MIIIGNGSSVLKKTLGEKIDSFDEVVRFNTYKILNYEKYVGSKTTHWWNVVNFENLNSPHLLKTYKEVCLHSWQWNPLEDKLWQKLSPICRAEKVFKSKETLIFELQQFAGTKYYGFSTGILAIWYYLKSKDEITIYGFDNFNPQIKHHYGDTEQRGTLHNGDVEKQIINKLIKESRVTVLT